MPLKTDKTENKWIWIQSFEGDKWVAKCGAHTVYAKNNLEMLDGIRDIIAEEGNGIPSEVVYFKTKRYFEIKKEGG